MTANSLEQEVVNNSYGLVTTRRVTYFLKTNWIHWLGSGSREDTLLDQIVSVKYQANKKVLHGLVLMALGACVTFSVIGSISIGDMSEENLSITAVILVSVVGIVFGLLLVIPGIWLIKGFPTVTIVTTGGTETSVKGWPWQKKEAREFSSALRDRLFR